MKGLSTRGLLTCTAFATSSLPVPLSPTTRMVEREGAAWEMRPNTCCMRALLPDDLGEAGLVAQAVRSSRFSSCSRRWLRPLLRMCRTSWCLKGLVT
jgi:hypothetical protein